MRRQSHLQNAILLLLAGTLAIGGPLAVHHSAAHHPQAGRHTEHDAANPGANHSANHSVGHSRSLPVEKPFPTDNSRDCLDCDLLSTLTVADTAIAADLVVTTAGWAPAPQPIAERSLNTDRAPRTTRGPPAA